MKKQSSAARLLSGATDNRTAALLALDDAEWPAVPGSIACSAGGDPLSNRFSFASPATPGLRVLHIIPSVGQVSLPALLAARAIARDFAPDVLHCWLYHGNLAGGLVCLPGTPLV